MLTATATYSPTALAQRTTLMASDARKWDQGWFHADITLAERSLR